jgi:hypothetical protein
VKIDRHLHLVIPVECDNGTKKYVHSTPIGASVFDSYFKVIAKTFAEIYGLGMLAGPRVAHKLLQQVATDMGVWEDIRRPGAAPVIGVKNGLVAEIHRLTNVLAPTEKGWETLPYYDAVNNGVLDAADALEVEAAISFFTVGSTLHSKAELMMLTTSLDNWSGRIESLNCTEFKASLVTSTAAASTGETATPS